MDGSLAVLNSDFESPARPEPPKSCPESDALGRGRAWILCRPRWETTSATLHAAQFRILISFSPANHMRKQVNNQSFSVLHSLPARFSASWEPPPQNDEFPSKQAHHFGTK